MNGTHTYQIVIGELFDQVIGKRLLFMVRHPIVVGFAVLTGLMMGVISTVTSGFLTFVAVYLLAEVLFWNANRTTYSDDLGETATYSASPQRSPIKALLSSIFIFGFVSFISVIITLYVLQYGFAAEAVVVPALSFQIFGLFGSGILVAMSTDRHKLLSFGILSGLAVFVASIIGIPLLLF